MVDYGADEARLLIKSGFVEDVNLGVVEGKTPAELVKYVNDLTDKEALTIAKQEMSEEGPESFVPTELPEPSKRYRLIWEMYNL